MVSWETEVGNANGYLAVPVSGEGTGVLVLHAWWGLNEFMKEFCDRLAGAGFVALAPDLFGNGETAETIAEAEQLVQNEDYQGILAVVRGAVDYLRGHSAVNGDNIGVVGFSFGAPYAMLAACDLAPADIGAVVLFYGNYPGLGPDKFEKAQAAFMGHFAEDDPYEELEDVEQTLADMHEAGRAAVFHVYEGTGHWFFESDRPDAYDAGAASLAWERTVGFFRVRLNGSPDGTVE